jgi:hypothetical protein
MAQSSYLVYNQKAITATAVTAVASGTTVGTATSNKILVGDVEIGTYFVAKVSMVVKTSSLTLTPKLQGSNDGTNWEDLFNLSSTAAVATAGGTGSSVTTARSILCPVIPYKYARVVFVTGGTTAHATDDTYALSYHWVKKGYAVT